MPKITTTRKCVKCKTRKSIMEFPKYSRTCDNCLDAKNILVTGGIPQGTYNTNFGELTDDEETTIRINVMEANEKLRAKALSGN